MLFQIEVKSQGRLIDQHQVEAADALTAINQVESYYGEPPSFEVSLVELEHGRKRYTLIVNNWHGYTFQARAIRADRL
jgi:hypothetical protein